MGLTEIAAIVIVIYIVYLLFFRRSAKEGKEKKNFRRSPMTQAIVQEFRQSPGYIDVHVYRDRVEWYRKEIRYNERGYQNITVDETRVLAQELLNAMPQKTGFINKKDYTVEPLFQSSGSGDPYGAVRHAVGDYSTDNSRATVGYRLHNKNYDGRYLKVYDETTRGWKTWDSRERVWVTEYKSW